MNKRMSKSIIVALSLLFLIAGTMLAPSAKASDANTVFYQQDFESAATGTYANLGLVYDQPGTWVVSQENGNQYISSWPYPRVGQIV